MRHHRVPLLRRSSAGRNRSAGHCLCQAVAHRGENSVVQPFPVWTRGLNGPPRDRSRGAL